VKNKMACTEEEFLELLSDESTVDIATLTEQAKYGIPDKVPTPPPNFNPIDRLTT
jgi:hypothetical protein